VEKKTGSFLYRILLSTRDIDNGKAVVEISTYRLGQREVENGGERGTGRGDGKK
jgi:hypothetical protein